MFTRKHFNACASLLMAQVQEIALIDDVLCSRSPHTGESLRNSVTCSQIATQDLITQLSQRCFRDHVSGVPARRK